jgi:hypothetical protein
MPYIRTKEAQNHIDGVYKKNLELMMKNDELEELSMKAAQAKHEFLVANAVKILELKAGGGAISLIRDLVKGDKRVAELQYKWDVAEGVLLSCRERIKDLRTQIDTYRSLLTWLREELRLTSNQEG